MSSLPAAEPSRTRYRFGAFTVSPARRVVLHQGRELPLIPRYFDLLVLLLERRQEAVHRHQIRDAVWHDVIVSDGALNQAIRTLRRTLGDKPRKPVFIRTVSRHGYRFVYPEVVEEPDTPLDGAAVVGGNAMGAGGSEEDFEAALSRLLHSDTAADPADHESERLDAAERLHELGTAEALRRIDGRPGHETARAFLREARWDVAGAGPVPLLGQSGALRTAWQLLELRMRRIRRLARARWLGAIAGGCAAGAGAGLTGGLVLRFGPGSLATDGTPVLLGLIGAVVGGLGAAGVGLGLAIAESTSRSARFVSFMLLGAAGGGGVGWAAHSLGLLALSGLFGRDLSPVAGGFEGLVLGAAVGLGYALASRGVVEGLFAPRGWSRVRSGLLGGACCALAALALANTGSYLGAMSLDLVSRSFPGSQVGLAPLSRLLGEPEAGTRTTSVISAWEGLAFGFGTVFGLSRRPRPARDAD
jgi:DNA-binding winged helix-turn-helix (wHTH) protein